jgi:hypothetical protein
MTTTRIKPDDSLREAIYKLSEGNPGAVRVLIDLFKHNDKIDPDNILGGTGVLLNLDMLGIYSSRIWMLYKDVCGEDYVKTVAMIRACQLGLISEGQLNEAIENYGRGIDVDQLVQQVKEALPNFNDQYKLEDK